jgi:hypothetical protein
VYRLMVATGVKFESESTPVSGQEATLHDDEDRV